MARASAETIKNHAAFIWSIADLLRGDYKHSEYGRVILPLTVLRRLDCVLEPTRAEVLEQADRWAGRLVHVDPVLRQASRQQFSNTSPLDLRRVLADSDHVAGNRGAHIARFSDSARDIIEHFHFDAHISARSETPAFRAAVDEHVEAEALPYVGDAWVDPSKAGIGHEIPLHRHSSECVPPTPLSEIDAEITQLEARIQPLLSEVTETTGRPGAARGRLVEVGACSPS